MTLSWRAILLILSILLMPKSFASSDSEGVSSLGEPMSPSQWQFAVAVGWGEKSNPLFDYDDIPVYVLPSVAWYGERAFFDNGAIGYTLWDGYDYSINLIGGFGDDAGWFNRWDPSNLFIGGLSGGSPAPATDMSTKFSRTPASSETEPSYNLKDRKLTYMGGGEVNWYTSMGNWRALIMQDILNVHNGQIAMLSWYNYWQIMKLRVDLTLSLNWKSSQLVDYYYGISADEASWGSPTYDGRGTFSPTIELDFSYPITKKLELLLLGRYTRFGAGIADSPLLKEDNSFGVFFGAAYRF
ncbi:MipA/OmpV family protein [Shewanella corallii]|uniref:MipA/OmpV family protein n=1 Tax=Shewanella corallii TaxID=560080 RepID=A0ABT0N2T9_9GAMM|nr:MipA/OmpV family protein [Shewanella corallii]MCL2912761.1 MipA/OmpV family protein [Shewanella corallii]